ncbi:hypothetical protein RCH20_002431 [Psychrobacter sp. PL15]|nr:hypothetical protein [Psychrobacter sp. PL15]
MRRLKCQSLLNTVHAGHLVPIESWQQHSIIEQLDSEALRQIDAVI